MKTNIKTLVLSLSLIASANTFAGLGGLNVQSNLGEPFSGSIVVTDKEAQALIQSGTVQVTGHSISGTVVPQSNGNAIVRLRSNTVINDPIIRFEVRAGKQLRQYSAMMSPASYRQHNAPKAQTNTEKNKTSSKASTKKTNKTEKINKSPLTIKGKGSYHRVQAGETVSILADRYRPQNMAHAQAVQAIIAANPRVFAGHSNGHLLYKDISIYIPFKSPTAPDVQTNAGTASTLPETQSPTVVEPANNATASSVATQSTTETASTPASSEPIVIAASETATASTTTASEAINASAPVASVESKPIAPPKTTTTIGETEDSSILSDLPWSSLGLGAAAILGLGGLALALRRRQNHAKKEEDYEEYDEDDAEEDDIDLISNESIEENKDDIGVIEKIASNSPKTVTQTTQNNTDIHDNIITEVILEDEDNIDDFIITETITPNPTPSTPDLKESTLSNTRFTSNNAIAATTLSETTIAATEPMATNNTQKDIINEQADNWLDNYFALDNETTINTTESNKTETTQSTNSWLEQFNRIDNQQNNTQHIDIPEEKSTKPIKTLDFSLEHQNESQSNLQLDDISRQSTQEKQDLGFLDFVLEDESIPKNNLSSQSEINDSLLSIDTFPVMEINQAKESESKKVATQSKVSTNSIQEDWLTVTDTPDPIDSTGFVSEAVGMAAPLEAKLELAKMYLEIDDAVAARETLRELIEESTGNIQQAAQQLLTELGA